LFDKRLFKYTEQNRDFITLKLLHLLWTLHTYTASYTLVKQQGTFTKDEL